ncbi:Uncharacterized protein dnl_05680 [Desulfonema limicola]|uniref:Uncharacterized protein n=1 Tax=Desulfonema limicola TaxID=45656 RepID=A0A975B3Z4_9BACT|nr:hypothetical protein [Desulfonema limicola]QTA78346.1 Uncharacterized protein dnl_05680 [Desulfonema limicola]
MFIKYSFLTILLSLLLVISNVWAIIPIPCRIGGTLTVNDKIITHENESDYIFIVTRENSMPFVPAAEDKDGLNKYNNYLIDIPIYEPSDQKGGAKPGDIGIINVYKNNSKLLVTSPPGGFFVVNEEGTQIQIDIKAVTGPGDDNKWDVGGDGRIGLEEAIQALQIVSGIIVHP